MWAGVGERGRVGVGAGVGVGVAAWAGCSKLRCPSEGVLCIS
jgi:hypothetical protein